MKLRKNIILNSINLFWEFSNKPIKIRIILAPILIILAAALEAQNVVLLKPLVIALTTNSGDSSLLYTITLFIGVTILTGLAKSINYFNNIKITTGIGSLLPINFFNRLLNMPFKRYSTIGSGTYIDIINIKVANIIRSIINPYLQLTSSVVAAIFVIIYILKTDFYLSLALLFIIAGSYFLVVFFTNKVFKRISNNLSSSSQSLNNIVFEALNNLREIKLMRIENKYISKLNNNANKYWFFYGKAFLLQTLPRYFLESIFLTSLALLLLVLYYLDFSLQVLLASLSALALGAQRLIPTFQNIFDSYASISTFKEDLNMFLSNYTNLVYESNFKDSDYINKKEFDDSSLLLKLRNVSFSYYKKGKVQKGFKNINFNLKKGEVICIKGPSGGGKSTFLDLISLLITPNSGVIDISKDLFLDDNNLSLGYVSQEDFLFNEKLINNITFKDEEKLNDLEKERLRKVINMVCLQDTINNLPYGLNTIIGENGNLLSGGQKQRVSIARVMFRDPKLLILDESTGRLDERLEKEIVNNLNSIEGLTIILVTHRSSLSKLFKRQIIIDDWNIEFPN